MSETRSFAVQMLIATTALLAAAAVLLIAGCAAEAGGESTIDGTEWDLVAASVSSSDLGAAGITISFADGQIGGNGGVNSYGGAYTAGRSGTLEIGEIASTLMAGPQELMDAEAAYFSLLREVRGYTVDGETLTLTGEGGDELLSFERRR